MTKAEHAARVAAHTSMSKAGADNAVNAVFSAIANALAGGETVTIAGSGTFSTRPPAHSPGPQSTHGESIATAASTAPSFKPGKTLCDVVN